MEVDKLGCEKTNDIELDPTKHYVCIVYSDGDNIQWIENGYNEFHTWQSFDAEVPVSWTFAPRLSEFSSLDVRRIVDNRGGDSFITGPSGAVYARVSKMYGESLEAYFALTASAMLKTGITTMTFLDEIPGKLTAYAFRNKLSYFARYDNIHGGILSLDVL